MERTCCLHGLGDNLVSLVRQGCRLGWRIFDEAVWHLGQGGGPKYGAAAVVYERFALCSLGCGLMIRAAS
jgi:hypothetical protein